MQYLSPLKNILNLWIFLNLATLAVSHSKAHHKYDYPAWKWPCAPWPKLQYPLEEHVRENEKEVSRCLDKVHKYSFIHYFVTCIITVTIFVICIIFLVSVSKNQWYKFANMSNSGKGDVDFGFKFDIFFVMA